MIKVENVKKGYKDFNLDCSIEINQGCITGLIGPNGVGKSTTFKAILGLISTDAGKITVFDKDINDFTAKDREKIGVSLADSGFNGYLTIKGIVKILSKMYEAFENEKFINLCNKFNLPLNKKVNEFSTGMKAKLKVLTAITHKATLLILDEPTAGLDVGAREDILDMLREYMEEDDARSILISSHISTDLENLCDDIYLMNDGKIILHEETDILLNNYGLIKVNEEQFSKIEKEHILYKKKEGYGYSILTNERQFYQENYPDIIIEKGNIDDLILMEMRGER